MLYFSNSFPVTTAQQLFKSTESLRFDLTEIRSNINFHILWATLYISIDCEYDPSREICLVADGRPIV